MDRPPDPRPDDIARRAARKPEGLLRELLAMLREHRRWWLTPIVLVLLLVGLLLVLSATPLGPFLYPLF